MNEFPEWATYTGYPKHGDRWTDLSRKAIERRKQESKNVLAKLKSINRSVLNERDQLNYDLYKYDLELGVEGDQFADEYLAIDQMEGLQSEVPQLLGMMPANNLAQYRDIIARLKSLPVLVEQTIALLKEGAEKGITPPKITLVNVPDSFESLVSEEAFKDPFKSPLLAAFQRFPTNISTKQQATLKEEAAKAMIEKTLPALKKLKTFISETYIPHCRESIGLRDLPNGKAWYAFKTKHYTTTTLTPQKIHEIGLSEVKRIRDEMDQAIKEANFNGDFAEFLDFLQSDSRFFYNNAEELVRGYRDIAKRIDQELPRLFGLLPRLPYGVQPVPSHIEKTQPTAYYLPGAANAGRPGIFYANTYSLKDRPKWEMEALTLHEAVPGHHLQISLTHEMQNVPEFRKYLQQTAFVEGWGLYAESLGKELGLYKDPYSHFGRLSYEMWRAIRLVVDTGIHSMGWSRQQAIDYFKKYANKSEHDITVEVDRYIVMPGQALAYKIGELKFKELRANAQKRLGEKFDIRAFHDGVLKNGALPLQILEAEVNKAQRR